MNPNIEVITPVLWGVNSFYVKAGWTKELLPIPQPPDQLLTGSKDVSLTDNAGGTESRTKGHRKHLYRRYDGIRAAICQRP